MTRRAIVTGGAGFIGAYLVRRLVADGWNVGVVDTLDRGDARRLAAVYGEVDLIRDDIRDEAAMTHAFRGAEVVFHLAAINGTENFYTRPELVLDVGIRGAIATVNACRRADVPDLVVASSAEVYQTAPDIPTTEDAPLMLPNPSNPRYSYGGSKIATELVAFHYGADHFRRMQVFRPHNAYGPDMGWKHVIPQFLVRAARARGTAGPVPFPIEGDGTATRAFAHVSDIVDGIMTMYAAGAHRTIYHIGTEQEVTIRDLAAQVGRAVGVTLALQPGPARPGGVRRRCPDTTRLRALGFAPRVSLAQGLADTAAWYLAHLDRAPDNPLM